MQRMFAHYDGNSSWEGEIVMLQYRYVLCLCRRISASNWWNVNSKWRYATTNISLKIFLPWLIYIGSSDEAHWYTFTLFVGRPCSHCKATWQGFIWAWSTEEGEREYWRTLRSHVSRSEVKTRRTEYLCSKHLCMWDMATLFI